MPTWPGVPRYGKGEERRVGRAYPRAYKSAYRVGRSGYPELFRQGLRAFVVEGGEAGYRVARIECSRVGI
jgi:hypothetical protein